MQALTRGRTREKGREKERKRGSPSNCSNNKPRKHPNSTITTAFFLAGNCSCLNLVLEQLVKVIIHTLNITSSHKSITAYSRKLPNWWSLPILTIRCYKRSKYELLHANLWSSGTKKRGLEATVKPTQSFGLKELQ